MEKDKFEFPSASCMRGNGAGAASDCNGAEAGAGS